MNPLRSCSVAYCPKYDTFGCPILKNQGFICCQEQTMNQGKSVLDNMKIKETGFPLTEPFGLPSQNVTAERFPDMDMIVSNCPRCNSPIYGPQAVKCGSVAKVTRTCTCDCTK